MIRELHCSVYLIATAIGRLNEIAQISFEHENSECLHEIRNRLARSEPVINIWLHHLQKRHATEIVGWLEYIWHRVRHKRYQARMVDIFAKNKPARWLVKIKV